MTPGVRLDTRSLAKFRIFKKSPMGYRDMLGCVLCDQQMLLAFVSFVVCTLQLLEHVPVSFVKINNICSRKLPDHSFEALHFFEIHVQHAFDLEIVQYIPLHQLIIANC